MRGCRGAGVAGLIGTVVSKKTRRPEHLRSPENRTRLPRGDGFSGPLPNGADRDGYGERQLRVAALGAFAAKTAMVVERLGQITGYASDIGFAGHAVAETNQDLKVLIGATPAFPGPVFCSPPETTTSSRGASKTGCGWSCR